MSILQTRSLRAGVVVLLSATVVLIMYLMTGNLRYVPILPVALTGAVAYAGMALLHRTLSLPHEGWKRLILLVAIIAALGGGLFANLIFLLGHLARAAALFLMGSIVAGTAGLGLGVGAHWVKEGFDQDR